MDLDDQLFREAKRMAAETHKTMTSVVEDALRLLVASRREARRAPSAVLPKFRGRGVQPGVDLDHSAGLLDRMEGRG